MKVITYKAEKILNGEVVDTFIESYYEKDAPLFAKWKYFNAVDTLKPNGAELRFFIDGEIQLLNC